MSSLLKELVTEAKVLEEKFEELNSEQLFHEILAQYKNLDVYKPTNIKDLYWSAGAIIGSAQDLIEAITRLTENSRATELTKRQQ